MVALIAVNDAEIWDSIQKKGRYLQAYFDP